MHMMPMALSLYPTDPTMIRKILSLLAFNALSERIDIKLHPAYAYLCSRQPIVTGTSVLALKYKDGIMMAADNLGALTPLHKTLSIAYNIPQLPTDPLPASRISNDSTQLANTPLSARVATCPISNISRSSWRNSSSMNLPLKMVMI